MNATLGMPIAWQRPSGGQGGKSKGERGGELQIEVGGGYMEAIVNQSPLQGSYGTPTPVTSLRRAHTSIWVLDLGASVFHQQAYAVVA